MVKATSRGAKKQLGSSSKKAAQEDDEGSYGDEEFEEYEEDEIAAGKESREYVEAIQESVKRENAELAMRYERLHKSERKSESKSAPEEPKKRSGSKASRVARSLLNPRLTRAKKIRESAKLSCERFVSFEMPPYTPFQWYRLRLGVDYKEMKCGRGTEEAEQQTAAAEFRDNSTQFSLLGGDDDVKSAFVSANMERLATFTRNVGGLFDALLEESDVAGCGDLREGDGQDIFKGIEWKTMSSPEKGRGFFSKAIAFSGSTMLTLNDEADDMDPKPHVLISMWDCAAPWNPSSRLLRKRLVGPGKATCVACGSSAQKSSFVNLDWLVCAGTSAGLVLAWDLRLPGDTPAYTSACLNLTVAQHDASIVSVGVVGQSEGGYVVSVDANGLLCEWKLVPEDDEKSVNDEDRSEFGVLRRDAQSRLKLVRALYVWSRVPALLFGATNCSTEVNLLPKQNENIEVDILTEIGLEDSIERVSPVTGNPLPLISCATISALTREPLCASLQTCLVFRVRQDLPMPDVYYVDEESREEAQKPKRVEEEKKEEDSLMDGETATSMAWHPTIPEIFAVGQIDGAVRVHVVGEPFCFEHYSCDQDDLEVVEVRWSQHRPAVLFVLYSDASLAAFDLTSKETNPIGLYRDLPAPKDECQLALGLSTGKGALSSRLVVIATGDSAVAARLPRRAVEEREGELKTLLKEFDLHHVHSTLV